MEIDFIVDRYDAPEFIVVQLFTNKLVAEGVVGKFAGLILDEISELLESACIDAVVACYRYCADRNVSRHGGESPVRTVGLQQSVVVPDKDHPVVAHGH